MTDKEKQSNGELYNPTAMDICEMRMHGTKLVNEFNSCSDGKKQIEILRNLFGNMGSNVRVNRPFTTDFGCHTFIGDDVVININCTFLDAAEIKIGNRVLIGSDVKMYTTFHPNHTNDRFVSSKGENYYLTQAKPIVIGDDTWICGNVTIVPGVHIGKNVVIGAGSVVTKDIPDGVIAAGNPCKVIRENTRN